MGTPYVPKTQKARGVLALKACGYAVPKGIVKPARRVARDPTAALEKARAVLGYHALFGRSCPPIPNHGGVPSRRIASAEDLKALADENMAYDKKSEIMFMRPIEAVASAIWTPGVLTLGEGHDGATAAKEAVVLPLIGSPMCDVANYASVKAGITTWPYMEIVYSTAGTMLFVQLRDGPKLPGAMADFIPTTMVVEKVITVSKDDIRDELAWARDLPTFTPGTVVYCPGAGLSSHYAVQCLALWRDGQPNLFDGVQPKAIPFITSREPVVGETLVPPPLTLAPEDAKPHIRAGYLTAWDVEIEPRDAVMIGLMGAHGSHAYQSTPQGSFFYGLAAGLLVRAANLICRGELRYKTTTYKKGTGNWSDRNHVYTDYWPKKKVHLAAAQRVFSNHKIWASMNNSIGGHKWYRIANHAVALHNGVLSGAPFLESYNKLANAVHNCGWAFNKLVAQSELDTIAADPAYAIVKQGASIWSLMVAAAKVTPKERRPYRIIEVPEEEYNKKRQALYAVPAPAKPIFKAAAGCPKGIHTCDCASCCNCTAEMIAAAIVPSPGGNHLCLAEHNISGHDETHPVKSIGYCACPCHPVGHCQTCYGYKWSLSNPGFDCKCECHGEGKKYALKKAVAPAVPTCTEFCISHTKAHASVGPVSQAKHPGSGCKLGAGCACSCPCHAAAVAHHVPTPIVVEQPEEDEEVDDDGIPVPTTPKPTGPVVTICKLWKNDNGAWLVHVQHGKPGTYDKWDLTATGDALSIWNAQPKVKSLADKGTSPTPYVVCTVSEDHQTVYINGGPIAIKDLAPTVEPAKPAVDPAPSGLTVAPDTCTASCKQHEAGCKNEKNGAHAYGKPSVNKNGCTCKCPCHKPKAKPAKSPHGCESEACVGHKSCGAGHLTAPNEYCTCPCDCHPKNNANGIPSCQCDYCTDSTPF